MKSKLFLIISFLIVGLTSCMTLTEYEKVVNAGYKQTKTYENYAASNDLDLLEKKDKIFMYKNFKRSNCYIRFLNAIE